MLSVREETKLASVFEVQCWFQAAGRIELRKARRLREDDAMREAADEAMKAQSIFD